MNKDKVFDFLHSVGLSSVLRSTKKDQLTVLSLHRVSPETNYFWNPMKPSTFENLLKYLQQHYQVISINDIPGIKKSKKSKPFAVLSFDDGYYDFYEYALPLLKKYKLPSNHNIVNECAENNRVIWTQRLNFIFDHCMQNQLPVLFEYEEQHFALSDFNNNWMQCYLAVYKWMLKQPVNVRTGLLMKQEAKFSISPAVKMMNWDQVAECAACGVEIGSHTYSHDVISTITDEQVLHKEIVQSAIELGNKINRKINILALPNGEGNERLTKPLANAGIDYLLFVEDKINDLRKIGTGIMPVYRINLVEESFPAMILRTELFHSKIKRYV